MRYIDIWKKEVNNHLDIHVFPINNNGQFYSYIESKIIFTPYTASVKPDSWDVFALLHEIGHILTNTPEMKRCLQEYLATQWAIGEAKEIGFKVPASYIKTYQDYIWKWRETSIKCRGKNVPSKEDLTLIA